MKPRLRVWKLTRLGKTEKVDPAAELAKRKVPVSGTAATPGMASSSSPVSFGNKPGYELVYRKGSQSRGGGNGQIRTADLPLRRRTLYPAELRPHIFIQCSVLDPFGQYLCGTAFHQIVFGRRQHMRY